jgi:hypothetical protein
MTLKPLEAKKHCPCCECRDKFADPIMVRVGSKRLGQLAEDEYASWEDAGSPDPGATWNQRNFDGYCVEGREHPYNILIRHPAMIQLNNLWEAHVILYHVLDNSIDITDGRREEAARMDGSRCHDYRNAASYLYWLESLELRIRTALDQERMAV